MKGLVLIVDDDAAIRFGVRNFLAEQGWRIVEASDGSEMWARLGEATPDVMILDHRLPDATALDLLARLREAGKILPTIVLTGFASIDLAVQAIQARASQFLTKPVDLPALATMVERLANAHRANCTRDSSGINRNAAFATRSWVRAAEFANSKRRRTASQPAT